jgi:phosphoesterase RecJ-like protein
VQAGAAVPAIARRIYRTKPNEQLRLFGRVLGRLETSPDGRVAWSVASDEDFRLAGAAVEHSEGLIDLLAQSATADVAILFKDLADGVRVSFRTRDGSVDATRLAGAFGGGGHARAAGASYPGPIDEATVAVLAHARRLLDELPAR